MSNAIANSSHASELQAALGAAVWLLAMVFAWSGTSKVMRPRLAALAMVDFRIASRPRVTFGLALGVTEVAVAVAMASGVAERLALGVASSLLIVSAALLVNSLRSGRRFPCRCFGGDEDPISYATLSRTGGLAMLAVVLWAFSWGRFTAPQPLGGSIHLQLVAAAALLATAVLASRVGSLLSWNAETVRRFRALRGAAMSSTGMRDR